jgi:hypothetical protein
VCFAMLRRRRHAKGRLEEAAVVSCATVVRRRKILKKSGSEGTTRRSRRIHAFVRFAHVSLASVQRRKWAAISFQNKEDDDFVTHVVLPLTVLNFAKEVPLTVRTQGDPFYY